MEEIYLKDLSEVECPQHGGNLNWRKRKSDYLKKILCCLAWTKR